ncbi:cysteine synthase [Klebsiella michiganensis]|nr:cysteine synthase [Klebsiella michiganensis]
MSKIFEDNSLTIGHTPLVRLNRIGNGRILAKVESRNPSFSVKCRIGANMIWDAEKRGVLKPGVELVERPAVIPVSRWRTWLRRAVIN